MEKGQDLIQSWWRAISTGNFLLQTMVLFLWTIIAKQCSTRNRKLTLNYVILIYPLYKYLACPKKFYVIEINHNEVQS